MAHQQAGFDLALGAQRIAGVDEAGRGPLAGPVVAAAVILNDARPITGLRDSKALSELQRETLAEQIRERALAFAVAEASVEEIDTLNVLQATLLAMRRAVQALSVAPDHALIDGNQLPRLTVTCSAVVGGDAKVPAISAASILAKTYRDHLMHALHLQFPIYGFAQHKGYGTAEHLAALRTHGPCEWHRKSYAPVREALLAVRA
jgi:ribonuclease HII